jgi:hypothetical protein
MLSLVGYDEFGFTWGGDSSGLPNQRFKLMSIAPPVSSRPHKRENPQYRERSKCAASGRCSFTVRRWAVQRESIT